MKTLNLKEDFLNNLHKNLENLINSYNNDILDLNDTIQKQNAELLQLKKNMNNFPKTVTGQDMSLENEILYYLLLNSTEKNRVDFQLGILRERFPKDATFFELKIIKNLIRLGNYSLASVYLNNMKSDFKNHIVLEEEYLNLLIDITSCIFSIAIEDEVWDEELLDCYNAIFHLFMHLVDTPYCISIMEYLMENHISINQVILNLNDTNLIVSLANCYFSYNLRGELQAYIQQIINEWDYLDSSIKDEEYIKLIWFAAYNEMDTEIINNSVKGLNHLKLALPEVEVYNIFSKIQNGEEIYSGRAKLDEQKNNFSLFNDFDKAQLIKYIDLKLLNYHFELKPTTQPSIRNFTESTQSKFLVTNENKKNELIEELLILEVSKLPNKTKDHPGASLNNHFTLREVSLAIYTDKYTDKIHHYKKISVQHLETESEYFISKAQLKKLRHSETGHWIVVNFKTSSNSLQKRERIQLITEKSPQKLSVNIPKISQQEGIDLNTRSALRNLGYQITGVTRVKRWEVLTENAIPKLGLRKVVDIIAFLIRGRKAMKNGASKNRYSISEWEYDLDRLKKYYYKNDFPWPKTTP